MSAHVLSNFLSKLGKSDKMRGLSSNLSHFCNKFDKLNDKGARMLDPTYHMTLKFVCTCVFCVKTSIVLPNIRNNVIVTYTEGHPCMCMVV